MNGPPPFPGPAPQPKNVESNLSSVLLQWIKSAAGFSASVIGLDKGPPIHLARLLLGLAVGVATFDLCFWGVNGMGLSLAVFITMLAAVILLNRHELRWRPTTLLILALLAGAVFSTALETSITNALVLLILIGALAGDTFFSEEPSTWGRGLSQVVALIRAPGRIFWLAGAILKASVGTGLGRMSGIIGAVLLTLPALALALVFGSLLSIGNAVFENWANRIFDWCAKELLLFLDPLRIAIWLFVAFLLLPFLRPANVSAWWWNWTLRLPRLPGTLPVGAAVFSSAFTLVVLNLLFLVANIADALFLWSGHALPPGVTYSGFVHSGVNTLTVTVLLSAFVLTLIFQQPLNVTQRRDLKLLGFAWVAQNLFLLTSVALRLKLYIEAYNMTLARLAVIIFLALVAAGYLLLTIKIARDRSLSWLVGGCLLAVFATFYLTQFLDLAGWSASYNVAQWEKDRTRNLDVNYLYELGAPAWPALHRVHTINPDIPIINDDENRGSLTRHTLYQIKLDPANWREFSLRAWLNRDALDPPR